MAIDTILEKIDAEIERLTRVRALLADGGKAAHKVDGRKTAPAVAKKRKKRFLSADARKRIADAQRKRWAAQRTKAKKEAKA
ncbi:MAG TPA: hypothetical protein VMU48_11030 [Terracidiphilus sp.]|nr:hypothetical protein [Terracidiphilus sp.]